MRLAGFSTVSREGHKAEFWENFIFFDYLKKIPSPSSKHNALVT